MPIVSRVDRLLLERRMTLTELADRVGVTIVNLSILKTNKARAIRFSTLEAICQVLGCQPGDLLAYVPGDDPEAAGSSSPASPASAASRSAGPAPAEEAS
jgi:putative transcriptional regulator